MLSETRSAVQRLLRRAAPLLVGVAFIGGAAAAAGASGAGATSLAVWPSFHFDEGRTGFNPVESAVGAGNVTELSSKWVGMNMGGLVVDSSPAVTATTVYVADSWFGRLWAFSTSCGSRGSDCVPMWSGQMSDGFTSQSSPAVAGGIVYVGSNDGRLYVFDADGCGTAVCQPLWTGVMDSSTGASSPLVRDGVVYIGDGTHLYAFPAAGCGSASCSPLWVGGLSGGGAGATSPAVANGVVYISSIGSGGKLFAFAAGGCGSATCQPLWSADAGSSNLIESGPAVANGTVYIGVDHGLGAFAAGGCGASTCPPLWTGSHGFNEFAFGTPAVANGLVFIGVDNVLEVFNGNGCGRAQCDTLWTGMANGTQGGILSSPAVANGVVYVGENSMKVVAFDTAGCGSTFCAPLWQGATDDSIVSSSPAIVDGVLYIGSGNRFYPDDQAGRLYAYSIDPVTANRPTISGFAPSSGVPGDTVTITGSHFTGATNVNFDNLAAAFTVDSDSQITATVPAGATSGDITVVTSDGAVVSAHEFAVANADFTLTTTPTSQIVTAGSGTSYTIGVWPNSSLTGDITLSVSGLPTGATATFTPAATASSSTLTIQTSHKAIGNSTLTITGKNDSFTHTATVTLQILKR